MRENRGTRRGGTDGSAEETSHALDVRLRPSPSELRGLTEQAEAFAQRHRLSPKAVNALLLVLEEAVTNVLMHAFEGIPAADREVSVRFRKTPTALLVTILDNGLAFDPTRATPRARREDGDDGPGGWASS